MTYPITITRQQLLDLGACGEGVEGFDAIAEDGALTVEDVASHVALLATPLAKFENWAIDVGLLPAIVVAAGEWGTATAGYKGTATAGEWGTATAGDYGTATAGECGTLIIKYWDRGRYRIAVGYVGEDGIEANKPYKVEVREGKPVFVEAT